ncbi:hypothetical protein D3C74_269380 [compost metagenome]
MDAALEIVPAHRFQRVQSELIFLHQRIHIRCRRHFGINRVELLLDLGKFFTNIFINGHFFRRVHLRELTDVPDSAVRIDLQLAVEQMLFRVHQDLDQGAFPASACSDKGAVLPFFECERNVGIQFFLREREG